MRELQRKQKIRRAVYSIPSLVVLFAIAFFLAKGAIRMVYKERESSERAEILADKAAALSLRGQELQESIARLKTEEGIEVEIRERFGVSRENEHVAIIVDEARAPTSTDASRVPWYTRFWHIMIGDK